MAAVKIYQPLAGLMAERLAWQDYALCRGLDPETWFPGKGGDTITAKVICNSCPVMEECRAYALERDENHGVWGGLSVDERQDARAGKLTKPSDGRGGPTCWRLTEQQQAEVLDRLREGAQIKPLAREYGVGQNVVRRLRDRYLKAAA